MNISTHTWLWCAAIVWGINNILAVCWVLILRHQADRRTGHELDVGSREYSEIAEALFRTLLSPEPNDRDGKSEARDVCFLSGDSKDPPAALIQRLKQTSFSVKPISMLKRAGTSSHDEFRTVCGNRFFTVSFDGIQKHGRNRVSAEVGVQFGPTFGSGDLYDGRKKRGTWVFSKGHPLWIS
jgi:hypothetical protein